MSSTVRSADRGDHRLLQPRPGRAVGRRRWGDAGRGRLFGLRRGARRTLQGACDGPTRPRRKRPSRVRLRDGEGVPDLLAVERDRGTVGLRPAAAPDRPGDGGLFGCFERIAVYEPGTSVGGPSLAHRWAVTASSSTTATRGARSPASSGRLAARVSGSRRTCHRECGSDQGSDNLRNDPRFSLSCRLAHGRRSAVFESDRHRAQLVSTVRLRVGAAPPLKDCGLCQFGRNGGVGSHGGPSAVC
jgi:hypothetical protein